MMLSTTAQKILLVIERFELDQAALGTEIKSDEECNLGNMEEHAEWLIVASIIEQFQAEVPHNDFIH